jgi:hypothetical protein
MLAASLPVLGRFAKRRAWRSVQREFQAQEVKERGWSQLCLGGAVDSSVRQAYGVQYDRGIAFNQGSKGLAHLPRLGLGYRTQIRKRDE